jgi:phage shock protein A
MLSSEAQAAISRGKQRGQSVEEALAADQLYQKRKELSEQQIATARKNLAAVKETITRIETILSEVGM